MGNGKWKQPAVGGCGSLVEQLKGNGKWEWEMGNGKWNQTAVGRYGSRVEQPKGNGKWEMREKVNTQSYFNTMQIL